MDRGLAELVRQRAGERCEYCLMPAQFDPAAFEIDHVIARKHGGATHGDNLALACFACNNRKGPNIAGIDPSTNLLTRLFHPRTDCWIDHFAWDGPYLAGRSAIGRATIEVLCMNMPHRVALRLALMEEGVF